MRLVRFTDKHGIERQINIANVTKIVVIDDAWNAIHTLDAGEQGLCHANYRVISGLLALAAEEHLTVQQFTSTDGIRLRQIYVIVDNVSSTEVRRDGLTHLHFRNGLGCLVDTQLWDSATEAFTTTVPMD